MEEATEQSKANENGRSDVWNEPSGDTAADRARITFKDVVLHRPRRPRTSREVFRGPLIPKAKKTTNGLNFEDREDIRSAPIRRRIHRQNCKEVWPSHRQCRQRWRRKTKNGVPVPRLSRSWKDNARTALKQWQHKPNNPNDDRGSLPRSN